MQGELRHSWYILATVLLCLAMGIARVISDSVWVRYSYVVGHLPAVPLGCGHSLFLISAKLGKNLSK